LLQRVIIATLLKFSLLRLSILVLKEGGWHRLARLLTKFTKTLRLLMARHRYFYCVGARGFSYTACYLISMFAWGSKLVWYSLLLSCFFYSINRFLGGPDVGDTLALLHRAFFISEKFATFIQLLRFKSAFIFHLFIFIINESLILFILRFG
jgi:hypothetical protein